MFVIVFGVLVCVWRFGFALVCYGFECLLLFYVVVYVWRSCCVSSAGWVYLLYCGLFICLSLLVWFMFDLLFDF